MDQNEALNRLRKLLSADTESMERGELVDLIDDAKEVLEGLDEWLSKGGVLPEDWGKGC